MAGRDFYTPQLTTPKRGQRGNLAWAPPKYAGVCRDSKFPLKKRIKVVDQLMKMKDAKKGYRPLTESEKRDDQILGALKTIRGTKKYYPPRSVRPMN